MASISGTPKRPSFNRMKPFDKALCVVLLALVALRVTGAVPSVVAPTATAAVYVFEKSDGGVPSGVQTAFNALNRKGVVATLFDVDTVDGAGQVPAQYAAAAPAAQAAGLPCLVVSGGGKVLRVVKSPTTAEQVLKAVGVP